MRRVAIGPIIYNMVDLRTQDTESEIETDVRFGKDKTKMNLKRWFLLWSFML